MTATTTPRRSLDKGCLLAALDALRRGDFDHRLPLDWEGIDGRISDAFNEVITVNQRMADELDRLHRVVGKEGKIQERGSVAGLTGSWADSMRSVNALIDDVVHPISETARVIGAVAKGDLSQSMTLSIDGRPVKGEFLRTAKTVNTMVNQLGSFASEVTRVAREVGTEGKLGGQAKVQGVAGTWKDLTDNVNLMASNLTSQVRNIATVTTAVARGDLTKKITVDVKGEILELKDTINTMVDQLSSFASEVTRMAREVGTEGKLGGEADVPGVAGTWKDLTDNVNSMGSNLTDQVRNIAEVATAIANGDLSKKITVDVKGEILELKSTINTMVDQLNAFASEVTRVAREVGTEGKLGGQADVPGVAGTWKDLTDNVNSMGSNLTDQVRNIADVATAIANGDLSKKITVDVKGEILELKSTINTMVDQLNAFASEVTRVAREVGTEGKLGGQADVPGVAGTWKDLTDNVNSMASNLTAQVRNIATVTTAVASGDLSKKITVDVKGEILELKSTINTMVDQLNAFASEVTRVAREVGTEGKLGGQADVPGVAGTWKDLTDNVNSMAGNLTDQVRNIATVTTAVANGDLSKTITVDAKGEILELKSTINTMVDQLNAFASEVTRVAREVGTEGKLGGQADVPGVAGTWKDLTDNVNSMAGNLTGQVRNIAEVATAIANGDLSEKITVDVKGEILQLKDTINTMVDQLRSFASEVTRVAREVGTEGKLGGQADVPGVAGTWKDLTDNVNSMANNLTSQVRNIADVTKAVAAGDLSKQITVDVKGEILELKDTINTMVDQLSSFAAEVTRVARDVGTEGKLGGQAMVKGVSGTWKDLTDNVNSMASNLTSQVRGIARVVTAVANGDLKRKLTVEAKGEIAALADTINNMTDTLAIFADQVTTVAREVGVEGKLGGQAKVPGAAGTWKDLTENVNQLAANLTTQVRAIADVATAVTKGDLTRSISVAAEGEVAALKDTINEMILNLKDTTIKNNDQDWLKTNLAKFSRMLQGQKDLLTVGKRILSELAPVVSAQHAAFYIAETGKEEDDLRLKLLASYAHSGRRKVNYRLGESLVGQCGLEKERILLERVPDDYITISSSLGQATPRSVMILPVLFEGRIKGVMELASFERFSPTHEMFLLQLTESIGIVINTIEANMRTEALLKQSQSLANELQEQQQELQKTNQELEEKAELLAEQNVEVERKNHEVEQARSALEEKAHQLALTSKYKSEFLANMSHELRTPLNSLLILSDQLARNQTGNLSSKQVEYSRTIQSSGQDLLSLINDILDLSKIESGTVTLEVGELDFQTLREHLERTFRHVAESKSLDFVVHLADDLPNGMRTDCKRLQQVLKNLLSNAFKFTTRGRVEVRVERAPVMPGEAGGATATPANRDEVLCFVVSDTGIGIPPEKQQTIFEAFQQADGSTSRKYGGTGLGLAISREISRMLGGEIQLDSASGRGSTFTLYLPRIHAQAQQQHPQRQFAPIHQALPLPDAIQPELAPARDVVQLASQVQDDRHELLGGEAGILIVDNDLGFSRYIRDIANDLGLKAVITPTGSDAFALAIHYRPQAVILDIKLQDIDGWQVLDHLKSDLVTRHVPVHVVSNDEHDGRAFRRGAVSAISKPVTREQLESVILESKDFANRGHRRLLLVDRQRDRWERWEELLGCQFIRITYAETLAGGLESESDPNRSLDAIVLVSDQPDSDLAESGIDQQSSGRGLGCPLIACVPPHASSDDVALRPEVWGVIQMGAGGEDLLVDQLVAALHVPHSELPESMRSSVERLHQPEYILSGRKILVVDDDIRNIFAMSSVLERYAVEVRSAENGRSAIEVLDREPEIDCVLMDIMMPEMDGYATMHAIRSDDRFKRLPIIALTAKAMKGDREKCIAAGASDYIAKPVDTDRLLSLLCLWLYQGSEER